MKKDKKNCEKRLKTVKKDEKRRKNSESGKKRQKRQKTLEKRQKMLEKRRNGKKLWKTAKIILGAASKFFLALPTALKHGDANM